MAIAADDDARAFLEGVGNVLLDLRDRPVVDQRALGGARLEAGRRLQLADRLRELLREGVVDAVLHQEAVGADAGLSGIAVLRGDRAFDRRIQVRIVEHDERRVAAQLE